MGWIFIPLWLLTAFRSYHGLQEMTVTTWASYAGKLQARQHYEDGRYRILRLEENTKHQFTGEMDGPFEIWTWNVYPEMRWFHETKANQTFVKDYNRTMKRIWDERQQNETAEQDNGAYR